MATKAAKSLREVRKDHMYFWIEMPNTKSFELGIGMNKAERYNGVEGIRSYCWFPMRPAHIQELDYRYIDDYPAIGIERP